MEKPMCWPRMTEDVLNYRGEWITLSGDLQKVVGHGKTLRESVTMAKESYEEHVFHLFVPKENMATL